MSDAELAAAVRQYAEAMRKASKLGAERARIDAELSKANHAYNEASEYAARCKATLEALAGKLAKEAAEVKPVEVPPQRAATASPILPLRQTVKGK